MRSRQKHKEYLNTLEITCNALRLENEELRGQVKTLEDRICTLQAERDEIRKMLSYPEDSAGAMMTTEYAWLPPNLTASEALDRLR